MKRNMIFRYIATGFVAIGGCMVSGCVSTDTVSARFPQVEANINSARTAGAEVYAPTPLALAEAKLAAARSAVRTGDMVAAARLTDEAMADADYARTKAPTEKAKNEALKLRDAIQVLRDEINRTSAIAGPTL